MSKYIREIARKNSSLPNPVYQNLIGHAPEKNVNQNLKK
jgi:hypothetical protein